MAGSASLDGTRRVSSWNRVMVWVGWGPRDHPVPTSATGLVSEAQLQKAVNGTGGVGQLTSHGASRGCLVGGASLHVGCNRSSSAFGCLFRRVWYSHWSYILFSSPRGLMDSL